MRVVDGDGDSYEHSRAVGYLCRFVLTAKTLANFIRLYAPLPEDKAATELRILAPNALTVCRSWATDIGKG